MRYLKHRGYIKSSGAYLPNSRIDDGFQLFHKTPGLKLFTLEAGQIEYYSNPEIHIIINKICQLLDFIQNL